MKRILVAGVMLAMMAPAVGMAQGASDEGAEGMQFINMADFVVDGEVKKAVGKIFTEPQRAQFEDLLKLKKNVLPKLQSTARDAALR